MKCQAQLGRASKRSLLATGRLRGTRSRGSLLELRSQRLGSASRQHCFSWETCPRRSATTSGHPSTSRSDVRRRLRSGPPLPQKIKWTSLDELEHLLYGAGNVLGGTRVSG